MPDTPLRVTGGQDCAIRHSHAPGDLVTINAGSQNGIEVGQEYYTRRILIADRETISPTTPATVLTSGWIRVYAVDDKWSLATITHACDTVDIGDHLEPFALPTMPTMASNKPKPERDNYGRVLTGESRKRLFGKGDYLPARSRKQSGREAGCAVRSLSQQAAARELPLRPRRSRGSRCEGRQLHAAGDGVA